MFLPGELADLMIVQLEKSSVPGRLGRERMDGLLTGQFSSPSTHENLRIRIRAMGGGFFGSPRFGQLEPVKDEDLSSP